MTAQLDTVHLTIFNWNNTGRWLAAKADYFYARGQRILDYNWQMTKRWQSVAKDATPRWSGAWMESHTVRQPHFKRGRGKHNHHLQAGIYVHKYKRNPITNMMVNRYAAQIETINRSPKGHPAPYRTIYDLLCLPDAEIYGQWLRDDFNDHMNWVLLVPDVEVVAL